jgi:hypothetical protein
MRKWYTPKFDESLAVTNLNGRDDSDRVEMGRQEFNP